MILCSFCRNMGLLPFILIVSKINPIVKFQANPLRIDLDNDDFVQLLSQHGVVTIYFDHLEK